MIAIRFLLLYWTKNLKKSGKNASLNALLCTQLFSHPIFWKLPLKCFYCCTSLFSIVFNEKLKEIGQECFSQCISLTSAIFPASLIKIGRSSFQNCSQLSNVGFLNKAVEIHSSAFTGSQISLSSLRPKSFQEMRVKSPFYDSACPVCKEEFGSTLTPYVLNSCLHVFCLSCIEGFKALSDKCPLCNKPFQWKTKTIFQILSFHLQ